MGGTAVQRRNPVSRMEKVKGRNGRILFWSEVLPAYGMVGVYFTRAFWLHAVHRDACSVIALEIANPLGHKGSVSDMETWSVIAGMIRASVIPGRIERDGSPVDLKGNPFVARCDGKQLSVSTRKSFWEPFGGVNVVPAE